MNQPPDKDFKPEEVDKVIQSYGKPIGEVRKAALMDKLRREMENRARQQSSERDQDRGRQR